MIQQRKIDLAEGKASRTQDIVSHMLVTCDDDGKLTHELDKILGLMVGGHHTACTFIVKYLAELPHVYHAVYKATYITTSSCRLVEIGLSKRPTRPVRRAPAG